MEHKNKIIVIGLLALIVGLLLGYFFGINTMPHRGSLGSESLYQEQEMEGHMYEDEIIDNDGAMQHAMDEMMLGFRGLEGEAYEEMFLREMIVHHIGAITMAEELLEHTDRPELRELAHTIIATQSSEVEMMRGWLEEWFTQN